MEQPSNATRAGNECGSALGNDHESETRTLIRVTIDDLARAERRVSVLMGDKAAPRRQWIEGNVKFTLEESGVFSVKNKNRLWITVPVGGLLTLYFIRLIKIWIAIITNSKSNELDLLSLENKIVLVTFIRIMIFLFKSRSIV